jgi:hypothetical protein
MRRRGTETRYDEHDLLSRGYDDEPAPGAHYTPPAPPPADMPIDPDKWRALDRTTRRALLRHHRRVTGS